jgi:hypothetical protein
MAYVALTAAAWGVPAGVALAGKPSGGSADGTGGGAIWFRADNQVSTMNSDGTGKAAATGDPQYALHGGHRWSIRWANLFSADGSRHREAFADRDDGLSVQLTDQPDLECLSSGSYGDAWRPNPWTPDGLRLAWIARRWVEGTVTEGGLYVATLTFGADGGITGLAAQPATPAFARPLVLANNALAPDIASFSWSPDASQFAYDTRSNGVRIGDLSGGDRYLVEGSTARWSPEGSWIAFFGRTLAYRVVRPDGSTAKEVCKLSRSTSSGAPCWSPTGSHIAFTVYSNYTGGSSVWRAAVSGGGATNLTSEYERATLSGWTQ